MRFPLPRSPLLPLGLALLALGLSACSNVCHEAAEHMNDCVQQRCATQSDDPMCAGIEEAHANIGQCSSAYVFPGQTPVGGTAKAQAERILTLSCEDIFAGAALGEGAGTGAPAN